MGRLWDMIQEALDTMGFFECPNLCRELLHKYCFLPWSLRCDWCNVSPHHKLFWDEQGRAFCHCPAPAPMPDGPTQSCCPLDTKYETRLAKGRKCKVNSGNPEDILKQARKGKGKSKVAFGTVDKGNTSGRSCATKNYKSVEFIGEVVDTEEARLIDVAIASSVATSRVESIL